VKNRNQEDQIATLSEVIEVEPLIAGDGFIYPEEASKILDISEEELLQLVDEEKIPALEPRTEFCCFLKSDIDAYKKALEK